MTVLASLTAAQHHDVWVVVGTLLAAVGLGILGLLLEPAARLRRRRRNRRATPPSPAALPRVAFVAATEEVPCITTLPERPAPRVVDDTFVMHRVMPVFDPRDTPTVVIPRQRGARHAR